MSGRVAQPPRTNNKSLQAGWGRRGERDSPSNAQGTFMVGTFREAGTVLGKYSAVAKEMEGHEKGMRAA